MQLVGHKGANGIKIRSMLPKDFIASREKQKIAFYQAVFIYILGGLVGTLWETLLNACDGKGFVYCNGSLFTPFNYVYGFGGLVIIACLHNRKNFWEVYIIGATWGGAVEYVLSFLEEKILGTRSWDYSDQFLNLNGRTSVLYMLVWGILCVAIIFLVFRPLYKILSTMPKKPMTAIAIVLAVFLVADLIITLMAMGRYVARSQGKAPLCEIGALIDKICNDNFMRIRFPKMKIKGT